MKTPIKNIELIRKAKNLSREYVAKKLSLNLSTYGKVERGETGLTLDRLYELAAIFKMEAEDILAYNKAKKGNVIYVPVEAQAGFLSGHTQERSEENKSYEIPFITGNELYMINAAGDSMFPTIAAGDHIIIEETKEKEILKYGKAYVIVATDGCVIKRIHSHESPKKFILRSDNLTYEPYEIDKADIISIWLIKGCFMTSLAPRNPFVFAENISQQYYKSIQK